MPVYSGIKLGTYNFYCSRSPVLMEQSVLLKLWGIPRVQISAVGREMLLQKVP